MALVTSPEWRQAIMARFRNQGHLRFVLELVPPGIREGASVKATNSESFSDPYVVIDGYNQSPTQYATLEPGRTPLSSDWILFPSYPDQETLDDWWSIANPGEDVVFSFIFDKAYDVPGLYVVWDIARGSHPRTVDVLGYDTAGDQIYSNTNIEVESAEFFIDVPMDQVKSVDLVIHDWSVEKWRYRITEVIFGINILYDESRISNSERSSSISVLSNELPTFKQSFEIMNYDWIFDPLLKKGASRYLAQRQRITAQWGFDIEPQQTKWLSECTMYLSEWDIPNDSQKVTLTASTRLSFLTQNFSKGVYRTTTVTFKDLALYILQNSDIIVEYEGEQPWIVPDSLAEYSTKAVLPVDSVGTLLMYIACATGHILDTDSATGYPRFRKLGSSADHQIGLQQTLGDPGISIESPLRSIKIGVYKYTLEESPTEIFNDTMFLKGTQTVEIAFTDNYVDLVVQVSGATLQEHQDYTSSTFLTIEAPESGQNITIVITGTRLVQTVAYIETYRDSSIQSGLDVVVENPLITESGQIQDLSDLIKQYYLSRQTHSVNYIGYPEVEAGDTLELTTGYTDDGVTVTVEQETLSFNGGWDGSVVLH